MELYNTFFSLWPSFILVIPNRKCRKIWNCNNIRNDPQYTSSLWSVLQMLSMRNGLSLHPMCLPGVLQSIQLPQPGMSFDERNGSLNLSRGMGTFFGNEESLRQSASDLPNQCALSNQPFVIPSATNLTISETSIGSINPLVLQSNQSIDESAQAHYHTLNLPSSQVTLVWTCNQVIWILVLILSFFLYYFLPFWQFEGNQKWWHALATIRYQPH